MAPATALKGNLIIHLLDPRSGKFMAIIAPTLEHLYAFGGTAFKTGTRPDNRAVLASMAWIIGYAAWNLLDTRDILSVDNKTDSKEREIFLH